MNAVQYFKIEQVWFSIVKMNRKPVDISIAWSEQDAQTFVKLFGKIEIEKTRENKSKRENKGV